MRKHIGKLLFLTIGLFILTMTAFFVAATAITTHEERINAQIDLFKDEIIKAITVEDTYTLRRFSESFQSTKKNEAISFIFASTNSNQRCFIKLEIPVSHMGVSLGSFEICKSFVGVTYQTIMNPWFLIIAVFFISVFTVTFYLPVAIYRKTLRNILEAVNRSEGDIYYKNMDDIQKQIIDILNENLCQKIENEKNITMSSMASQVSHDIRSPLSALNMILGALDQIPEEKRILIRNSVQRINDIANQLLQISRKQKEQAPAKPTTTDPIILIPSLVDYLVSEKRLQFREKANVHIEADLSQSYGLFVQANPNEIKRVLSNLINNSVEAFDGESGKVTVALRDYGKNAAIMVVDNGKGIPESILKKLGEKGVSHGKEGTQSGSGLGVFHAKQTVEQFRGQFTIQSKEDHGTIITMTFPKATPPKWFVEKLEVLVNQQVVVLDDDISIHNIWKGRLQSIKAHDRDLSLLSFTSGAEFKIWVLEQPIELRKEILFLVDFELLNQVQTGLDLIEELKIKATLVTSRYEEKSILSRCESLGIGLIPKGMAGLVPIKIAKPRTVYDVPLIDEDRLVNRPVLTKNNSLMESVEKIRYDLCLIDDDRELIQTVWASVAESKGLKIKMFTAPQEFFAISDTIDRNTPIFIDVSLGNGIKGTDVAHDIYQQGFIEINLATGYDPDSIEVPPFIKRVVGKDFQIKFKSI